MRTRRRRESHAPPLETPLETPLGRRHVARALVSRSGRCPARRYLSAVAASVSRSPLARPIAADASSLPPSSAALAAKLEGSRFASFYAANERGLARGLAAPPRTCRGPPPPRTKRRRASAAEPPSTTDRSRPPPSPSTITISTSMSRRGRLPPTRRFVFRTWSFRIPLTTSGESGRSLERWSRGGTDARGRARCVARTPFARGAASARSETYTYARRPKVRKRARARARRITRRGTPRTHRDRAWRSRGVRDRRPGFARRRALLRR